MSRTRGIGLSNLGDKDSKVASRSLSFQSLVLVHATVVAPNLLTWHSDSGTRRVSTAAFP